MVGFQEGKGHVRIVKKEPSLSKMCKGTCSQFALDTILNILNGLEHIGQGGKERTPPKVTKTFWGPEECTGSGK